MGALLILKLSLLLVFILRKVQKTFTGLQALTGSLGLSFLTVKLAALKIITLHLKHQHHSSTVVLFTTMRLETKFG